MRRQTPTCPCGEDGEVGGVHQVLHERVHTTRDGLGHKARVMMAVIGAVQGVVMQRAMQPMYTNSCRGSAWKQQGVATTRAIRRGEGVDPRPKLMHQGHDDRL